MKKQIKYILIAIGLFSTYFGYSQQDPQFSHYMYNTMSVNPGYTGSRGHLTILGLHRSQWVGLNGAPTTQTLGIDSPVGKNVGLGFVLVNDAIGPANETYLDLNFSYTVKLNRYDKRLSFGIKGGGRLFNVDFSKGIFQNPDAVFENNIKNKFFPTIGAGVYYHTRKSYIGLSIPNFFSDDHYSDLEESVAAERMHYFLIGGTVFDVADNVKLKPSFLVKYVPGAPVIADVSANALINETLTLGLAYRWDDSFAGLIGLQVSPRINIGYAYDLTSTKLKNYNSGTHEIMIRFELKSEERKLKSPRFY